MRLTMKIATIGTAGLSRFSVASSRNTRNRATSS